jgi:WD40 repeat protein
MRRICLAMSPFLIALWALVGAVGASASPVFTPATGSPFFAGNPRFSSDPALLPFSVAFSPDGRLLATADEIHAVSVYSVGVAGALTPVSGSPFDTNTGTGTSANSVAFSPNGQLLASANSDGTVSIFSVGPAGTLTQIDGSPFPAGSEPASVAFSADGGLLATANEGDHTVSVFSVGSDGTLKQVDQSPFTTGNNTAPFSLAFSPAGGVLAVADDEIADVTMFTVGSGGVLTQVVGSPFAASRYPVSVAFSPDGHLLATGGYADGTVSLFSVSTGGVLTNVSGSPFTTGAATFVAFSPNGELLAYADASPDNDVSVVSLGSDDTLTPLSGSPFATDSPPQSVAFSPDGSLLATADPTKSTVEVFTVAAPSASISSPSSNQTYTEGESVATAFSCQEASDGPGLASCEDSSGANSPGKLNTATPGQHTYTVTAISKDRQTDSVSITYTVTAPPPAPEPKLSALRLKPRRFKPATHGPGTTISYRDTLAATTRLQVLRCTVKHHRCAHMHAVGSFSHHDHAGSNRLRFTGRIHRHALAAGLYELRVVATFHGRHSKAVNSTFTIV